MGSARIDFNIFLFASSRVSAGELASLGVVDDERREKTVGLVVDMIAVVALSLA